VLTKRNPTAAVRFEPGVGFQAAQTRCRKRCTTARNPRAISANGPSTTVTQITASTRKVKIVANTPKALANVLTGFQPKLKGTGRGSTGFAGRKPTVRMEYSSALPL